MEQKIDPDKMISYVAPDYPGANDSTPPPTQTSMLGGGVARTRGARLDVMRMAQWIPTMMTQRDRIDARSAAARRHLPRWARANFEAADRELASLRRRPVPGVPGMPQGVPHAPTFPQSIRGQRSRRVRRQQVNLNNKDVRIENVENNSYVGVQYYYTPKGSGMGATAAGFIAMKAPTVRCVLTFSKDGVDSAGISIVVAAGIQTACGWAQRRRQGRSTFTFSTSYRSTSASHLAVPFHSRSPSRPSSTSTPASARSRRSWSRKVNTNSRVACGQVGPRRTAGPS